MYEVYTVMENETIEDVAKKVKSSKDDIYKLNGLLEDDVIYSGMLLVVPKVKDNNFWYYTVKKGDNIYNIAKEYNIDYPILLALNGLDEGDYIYPNQTLIIPKDDINVYLTKENDTLGNFLNRDGIDINDFLKENESICLREKQIVIFRNK